MKAAQGHSLPHPEAGWPVRAGFLGHNELKSSVLYADWQ